MRAGSDVHTLPLARCSAEVADQVGGKAVGLGGLMAAGLPVPPGFAVTTHAYREALGERLAELDQLLVPSGSGPASPERLRALVEETRLPTAVDEALVEAYLALGTDVPVAVRSSATAEDAADASFAGQQDTYLWVQGIDAVREHVVRCWGSLFTPHAIAYRERMGYGSSEELAMAVVVQEMVDADAAGVALTLDPASGARDVVYVEAALGLGEGVVRGDVPTDRHWIPKGGATAPRTEVSVKDLAHCLDPETGEVERMAVVADVADLPALSEDEVVEVGALAEQVEAAFGRPMDIEWAIASDRRLLLLQARPETVWSRREALPPPGEVDTWDPLHHRSPPEAHWTTTNLGETAPGVLSPLGWTLWGSVGEAAIRRAGWNLGVLADEELAVPADKADRYVKAFYGRAALQVEFLATLGDRMPGTSGEEAVRSILGEPPEDLVYAPTRERYPVIARKLTEVFARTPSRLRAEAERTERWWRSSVAGVDRLDRAGAAKLFDEAALNFERTLALQTTGLLGVVQPLYDALGRLCEKTGVGHATTLSAGYSGFKEVAVVGELWKAARGETSIAAITAEHGFHGPLEGELASRVWREDPEVLERLLDEYRSRPDPRERDRELAAQRRKLEADLVAAVPLPARPAVRGFLALCARRIPLRGVAKRSFLQSIDVCRAAARRFGDCLVADGLLEDREDVFMLTKDELTGRLPDELRELVVCRRARREAYRALLVPAAFKGDCVPLDPAVSFADEPGVITGIGVSSGVVEGTVRVLESSSSTELKPNEILVAPATDPSWSSIMFISAALVVDIGGALSHASMVARELGIPCVVNTMHGTQRLRTGDRVRVDGTRGIVELLD